MHPQELRIEDYTYNLPDERIARFPLAQRDRSRLLVYKDGLISDYSFHQVPHHIPGNTLMVFNQAKVIHARLYFRKATGSTIEVFCLAPDKRYADVQTAMQQKGEVYWECLVGGASKWKPGMELSITNTSPAFTLSASIHERSTGSFTLHMRWTDTSLTFAEVLHHTGKVPLPPYMKRDAETGDDSTYQTVYAKDEGSVAAPTAGLHFTDDVLHRLQQNDVQTRFVTLHVGAGTFIPVKAETMGGHNMHAEWIEVTLSMIEELAHTHKKIVAVGTTSMRTLESLYWIGNDLLNEVTPDLSGIAVSQWHPYTNAKKHSTANALNALCTYMKDHNLTRLITRTQIIIAPGYTFHVVSGLVTNFHQPQSTLLLLVAALVGPDWKRIYEHALQNDYRFLSYGDSSLLWLRQHA